MCRSAATSASRSPRARPLRGVKPKNVNGSGSIPDATSAASNADGPGIGTTRCPASTTLCTIRAPGSEISGVPASETIATSSPASSHSKSCAALAASLWACAEVNGVEMP